MLSGALVLWLEAEKQAGRMKGGRPQKENGTESEPFIRVKLEEIGVDKKLSARSQKLGRHHYQKGPPGVAQRAYSGSRILGQGDRPVPAG